MKAINDKSPNSADKADVDKQNAKKNKNN